MSLVLDDEGLFNIFLVFKMAAASVFLLVGQFEILKAQLVFAMAAACSFNEVQIHMGYAGGGFLGVIT